ncbi:hypothetical protein K9M18_00235 [Candidatus Woesearchaeota archaeon]|nr:hypothetical protein [Candidatus Woesearchaeota archaeon]MCF8012954.1 hypothetical protein [Candidatus Woesearchaeota archaeon]
MERFQELREKAKQDIRKADHLLTTTYSLIQEPKILLSVANNLFIALENTMTALLEYERTFKRIPAFSESFDLKFTLYKNKLEPKYNLNKDFSRMLQDLNEIVKAHGKSPIEFSRKDKYVICSDSYEVRTLSQQDLKRMLSKAKVFIELINNITKENDRIFK